MNTLFRAILAVTILLAGCKEPLTKSEVDPDSHFKTTYTLRKEDQVYNGPYTKIDSAGVLIERGNFLSGKMHGIREILFPDGIVKVRERYIDGEMTDLYEYYYPNGKHELKGYYIDGAMYGPWMKYDDRGNLIEVVTMIENEEMGPFTEYFADGKIQAQGMYLHGPNEDGLLNLFNESGELYKTMLCDSGRCLTTWQKE